VPFVVSYFIARNYSNQYLGIDIDIFANCNLVDTLWQ